MVKMTEDRIHELEQELKIRTEENAELYSKLCNALKELEETKRRIQIYDEHNKKNFELFNQVSKTAQEMEKKT